MGVLTIRFISSGLSLQGLPFYVESLAIGAVLLAVIVLDLSSQSERLRTRWQPSRPAPAARGIGR